MLNYTILAFTISYLLSNDTDAHAQHFGFTVAALVGLSLVMYLITVIYLIATAIRSIGTNQKTVEPATVTFTNPLPDRIYEMIEKPGDLNNGVHYMNVMAESDLREPLMDM